MAHQYPTSCDEFELSAEVIDSVTKVGKLIDCAGADFENNGVDTEAVETILKRASPRQRLKFLQLEDRYGCTFFGYFVRKHCNVLIKNISALLDTGSWFELMTHTKPLTFGWTALHDAIESNNIEAIVMIDETLRRDQWYDLLQMQDVCFGSPLQLAACEGHTVIVEELHQRVDNKQWRRMLSQRNTYGFNVLHSLTNSWQRKTMEVIKNTLRLDEWIDLLSIPLPGYSSDKFHYSGYNSVYCVLQDLRVEAKILRVIRLEDISSKWY